MTAPSTPGTTVALAGDTAKNVPAIVKLLDAAGDRLLPLLPAGISYDRIKSEVFFAVRKDPSIAECTPDSIVRAVGKAMQRDLIIGDTIHLVPKTEKFKDADGTWQSRRVLNAWNDYKGDIELVLRSGAAQDVTAHPVYENEFFEYREELEPVLRHDPSRDVASRGKLIGAYARFRIKFGYYKVCWVTIGEINEIRAKSQAWSRETECPWWYAVKTAVHRGCKLLPKNPRLAAYMKDEDEDFDPMVKPPLERPALPPRIDENGEEIAA